MYPDVGEYEKSDLLALEKEVLGIYVSGHPLEEQEECWRKNISAVTTDFQPDEETGFPSVTDGAKEIVGGIITDKKIKYTKNNKTMAFLTLEALVGSMEIVVFPRDYEKNAAMMQTDARVFIQGRVSAEDDKPSKLICEKIFPFAGIPKELWIQFPDKETYEREVADLYQMLHESDGKASVILYIKSIKAMKKLPPSRNVQVSTISCGSVQSLSGFAFSQSRANCLSKDGWPCPGSYPSAGQKRELSGVSISSPITMFPSLSRPNSNLVSAIMIPLLNAYSAHFL